MSEGQFLIRGGTVVDGTGRPGYQADVAVGEGRVLAVGPDAAQAVRRGARVLDAGGQVVSPGFIDIHTHYDAQVFWDPWLTPSAYHGVTTVVAGNCGFSIAPIGAEEVPLLARTLQHVEDMSFDTLTAGVPWDSFETFPQYLDAVEGRGVALNYGCYVGHTAVRLYVMREDAYERTPTAAELAAMQQIVGEAIDAGAMGFASSTSPTHNGDRGRPVPSRVADPEELRALLEPLRERRRGVVALVPKGVEGITDLFALQRHIQRPITWTALLTRSGSPFHRQIVDELEAAWAEGAEVWPQVSCRPLVLQINMAEPFTLNARPAFTALMSLSFEERVAVYRDPQWRARAWSELETTFRWPSLSVAESERHPELIGRKVVDLAAEQAKTPLDVILDLSLAEGLRPRFDSVLANDDPDAIAWLLPRDHVLFGLADSGAHVSQLCDACFATDLLGTWVRDREVMTLERAIHKLTQEPATVYGLDGRGTIAAGQAADICVFDPATVAPGPVRRIRDFPADGERLTADSPEGMNHVLVNGTPIRLDGTAFAEGLDARPGTVLR